jgi:hypothetical protein
LAPLFFEDIKLNRALSKKFLKIDYCWASITSSGGTSKTVVLCMIY